MSACHVAAEPSTPHDEGLIFLLTTFISTESDSSADVAPVRFSHTTSEEPVDYSEFVPRQHDRPVGLCTPFSAPAANVVAPNDAEPAPARPRRTSGNRKPAHR